MTSQLWDIFLANIGLRWAMPTNTPDVLTSWSTRGETKAQMSFGKQFQDACGELSGRRGTQEPLKTKATPSKR